MYIVLDLSFHLTVFKSLKKSLLLVLANKNDIKGSLGKSEVSEALGLSKIQTHQWHIQSSCALTGSGYVKFVVYSFPMLTHDQFV